jgi:hypothetical protein
MAKKQSILAPAAVVAPAPEPLVVQPIEPSPEPVVVPVEVPPARMVAVVQLRAGYTQCRSAGVVFGLDPIEFALDDWRLPEFRACKYLTVN